MTSTTVSRGSGDLLRTTLRDHLGTESPRLVVLAMSRDENPKATILAFAPDQLSPRLVVKAALTEGAISAVRAEGAALRAVAALDPGLVGGTVPRVVDERQDTQGAVLVTEARPGTPMSVDYHRWRHTARAEVVGDDFACATAWLRELGQLPVAQEAGAGRDAPALVARLRDRWPDDRIAHDVAQGLADLDAALRLPPGAPQVVVHGDFWSGNVLRAGGRVTGVVDWEHALVGGDPIRDRARFVLSYALYLDRHTRPGRTVPGHPGLVAGPWGEPIRYAVRDAGWLPSLVAGFLSEALVETGRDPGRWRDVLTVGVAEIAALSDHADFARRHLLLAAELLR
ncbi:hypothetical protein GCM10027053_26560 [Intrasporangium mesophilum]